MTKEHPKRNYGIKYTKDLIDAAISESGIDDKKEIQKLLEEIKEEYK